MEAMGNEPQQHYRAQAALCRQMAANAHSKEAAAEFLDIADLWLSMVEDRSGGSLPPIRDDARQGATPS